MAKDKERTLNPAQAQRKLEKQRAIKKGKAEALARRNEKLARRNPDRIQRQIDEIKAIEASGQPLRPREKQVLEQLERDLRAVKKAREALGDKAPKFEPPKRGPPPQGDSVLGKRSRDGHGPWRQQHQREESDSSDTDESVRNIPMPRDTPPPIPRQRRRDADADAQPAEEGGERKPHPLPPKPPVPEAKTVYEAAPAIRDLRKEAVSKFVPAAVRMKQEAIKGQGKLLEPEEMDRLEKAGYVPGAAGAGGPPKSQSQEPSKPAAAAAASVDEAKLAEEEERFKRELESVEMEGLEDEQQ